MQKLIKLSDDHYIIVDDSEIKEGDYWVYICPINGLDYGDNKDPIVKNNLSPTWFEKLHDRKNYYKITHSTEPLESIYSAEAHEVEDGTFRKVKPLSLSEVEETINGYSVEK